MQRDRARRDYYNYSIATVRIARYALGPEHALARLNRFRVRFETFETGNLVTTDSELINIPPGALDRAARTTIFYQNNILLLLLSASIANNIYILIHSFGAKRGPLYHGGTAA